MVGVGYRGRVSPVFPQIVYNLGTNWIQFTDISGKTSGVGLLGRAGLRVACLSVLPCDVDHISLLFLSIDSE